MKHRHKHVRRGMMLVLAMLYLVLFGTLAIGFYAATNTASQVASNDQRVARAFLAAESGMDFMRYQLAQVSVASTTTDVEALTNDLLADLRNQMEPSGNLGAQTLAKAGTRVIQIPGDSGGRINLDAAGDTTFRATITVLPDGIVVKADGYYGTTSAAARAIQMDFTRQEHSTNVFDYAVASKGQVVVAKGAVTSAPSVSTDVAAIMSASATPASVSVDATIGGDISVVEGGGAEVGGGADVGGSSNTADILANQVHEVYPPEFPIIDATVYKQFATNTYGAGVPLKNVLIPAGTTKKFAGNQTIQGIVYIEAPATIEFQGNVNLQGFIVVEPSASGAASSLKFTGNLTMTAVPNQPEFDELRTTSGVAILAPDTDVHMTGSAGGLVKGNVITKTFTFQGASNLLIDQGTIMTFSPETNSFVMDSSKSIKFTATGTNNQPTGALSYSTFFHAQPQTYQEVMP